jgi:hypothetical protein
MLPREDMTSSWARELIRAGTAEAAGPARQMRRQDRQTSVHRGDDEGAQAHTGSHGGEARTRALALAAFVCGIVSLACVCVVFHRDFSGSTGGLFYGAPLFGVGAISLSLIARKRGSIGRLATAALVLGTVGTGGFVVVMVGLLILILAMGR